MFLNRKAEVVTAPSLFNIRLLFTILCSRDLGFALDILTGQLKLIFQAPVQLVCTVGEHATKLWPARRGSRGGGSLIWLLLFNQLARPFSPVFLHILEYV